MERQRSPGYPALSLEQAIEMVGKIHRANRTNIISRETAAKDMGYSGLTGRSLTVLAALAQYGLVERAGKGDIKVTRQAVEILHPVEDSHRVEAILQAASAPALFRMLHERFPEGVPSQNALRSFLVQKDFNDVALSQVISSFLETDAFAEKAKESGKTGVEPYEPQESPSQPQPSDVTVTPAFEATQVISHRAVVQTDPMTVETINQIAMNIKGDRVTIGGTFDLKGLRLLERKIASLKGLLAADEDEEDIVE